MLVPGHTRFFYVQAHMAINHGQHIYVKSVYPFLFGIISVSSAVARNSICSSSTELQLLQSYIALLSLQRPVAALSIVISIRPGWSLV